MVPFALPMFLTPRLGAGLATRYSGRTLLTLGLATTLLGDLLLYAFVLMKTAAPDLRLAEAYELNRRLFDPLALTASLYKLTSSR